MQTDVQKDKLARFGRVLALLLNRSLMYQANHPFVKQSVADVLAACTPLLESISPLVFILSRGQFYIDEEMLDPRLNVSRTAALFKSSGLQSISFEKGLLESELIIFADLFASLTQKSTAEAVKENLIRKGVFNVKINHVVYKKVTADDQVVSRDALKKITPLLDSDDQLQRKQFMETLLESVLTEEFAKTLNISNLMANPKAFTQQMINADLTGSLQLLGEEHDKAAAPAAGEGTGGSAAAVSREGEPHTQTGAAADMQQTGSGGTADSAPGASLPGGTGTGIAVGGDGSPASGGHPGTASTPEGDGTDASGGHPGTASPPTGDGTDASGAAGGPSTGVSGSTVAGDTSPVTAGEKASFAGGMDSTSGAAATGGGKEPAAHRGATATEGPGTLLIHQIEVIHQEVEKHLQGHGEVSLSDLAQSIFEMKKQLLEGIQAQKALGIAYANEAAILNAANKLSDQVMVELIKEEYQAGAITPHRLAHLIIRIIPEADELRRLLPQIKRALLQEGMPPADYLKLIHALRDELQSEDLVRVLQESSESIGLDGDMLIEEVKRNPAQAGELIYLASQIRKGGGDESALSDILVEYVERLGDKMAKDAAGSNSPDGAAHMKQVMTDVESTILTKLGQMNVNTNLLKRMEERINERMESILDDIRVQWLHTQTGSGEQDKPKMLSVLQTLEHNVGDDEELSAILDSVREKVEAGEIEENNFSQIHTEIMRLKMSRDAARDDHTIPDNVLTSEEIMFVLEKEVARAKRYGSPFSALAFAFVTAKPEMKSHEGMVTNEAVLEKSLEKLANTFRTMDYIGQIGKNKILVLLPMAYPEEAKKALARVLRLLHAKPLDVKGIPVQLRVAGVAAGYDAEQIPDARAFVKRLSHQLTDMVARIKNIQVLF